MVADIKLVCTIILAGLVIIAVALATLWAIWVVIVSIWLYKSEAVRMLIAGAILGAWIDTILWQIFKKN